LIAFLTNLFTKYWSKVNRDFFNKNYQTFSVLYQVADLFFSSPLLIWKHHKESTVFQAVLSIATIEISTRLQYKGD